jgi:L-fuculose-phosphate aldolase
MDSDKDIRFKIAAARRILFRAGLDPYDIAGQVTARVDGEDALWTTPLELFDETRPDHVVKMPFGAGATDNKLIEIDGESRPLTTASRWVEAIYRARPDVTCIIHTHASHIAAVAATGETVQLYNNRSLLFVGQQALYDDNGLHTDSPPDIVKALGDKSILIMRNHGAAVTGASIEEATAATLLLEQAARVHVLGKSIGGTPFPDHPRLIERAAPHRANLCLVWDAHVRRLRQSDPELFA